MTIVVVGCGPVALCAIISALEYKPARIFVIDWVAERLNRAKDLGCIPLNFKEVDPVAEIMKATGGMGASAVIEVVGLSPALRTAYDIICPGGKISSIGMLNLVSWLYGYTHFDAIGVHNGDLPFTAADCYNKNIHIQFGRCPVRHVFNDALQALIRNKDTIERLKFIDLVVPGLDESYSDALQKFEKAKVNKVVFKPNGINSPSA